MSNLEGNVVLVTGGGQGLGEAITRTLAKHGMKIGIADIKEDQVRKLADELGDHVMGIKMDVSDEKSVQTVVEEIIKKFGKLDVVINNAGIDVTKPLDEMSIPEWDRIIAVNLRGPFIVSKIALPHLRKQKSGHIINICSTAALRAWENASAYHASKWGLRGLSHAMFTELRKKNIKVTAVIAGGMRTPFILERFPDTPLDKLQDPKNVAETIRFILSQPKETIIPEVMVVPLQETSWP